MAMKIYGAIPSPATQRVLVCLNEKGLDYQFVPVRMKAGEHKADPFLSINPFGQVPALEHGDLKIFESRAITQYIAYTFAANGTPVIVNDLKKMATVSVWMEAEAHQFDPAASKLVYELFIKPLFGMTTDEALVSELEVKMTKVLDVYESRLEKSKYLGGEAFTLADLHHLPALDYLMNTRFKVLLEARPHVSAWCKEILDRPAWKKVAVQKEVAFKSG